MRGFVLGIVGGAAVSAALMVMSDHRPGAAAPPPVLAESPPPLVRPVAVNRAIVAAAGPVATVAPAQPIAVAQGAPVQAEAPVGRAAAAPLAREIVTQGEAAHPDVQAPLLMLAAMAVQPSGAASVGVSTVASAALRPEDAARGTGPVVQASVAAPQPPRLPAAQPLHALAAPVAGVGLPGSGPQPAVAGPADVLPVPRLFARPAVAGQAAPMVMPQDVARAAILPARALAVPLVPMAPLAPERPGAPLPAPHVATAPPPPSRLIPAQVPASPPVVPPAAPAAPVPERVRPPAANDGSSIAPAPPAPADVPAAVPPAPPRSQPPGTADAAEPPPQAPEGGGMAAPAARLSLDGGLQSRAGVRIIRPGADGGRSSFVQTDSPDADPAAAAAAAGGTGPLARFARPFQPVAGKPVFAVVLFDAGAPDLDRAALASLPFPVSFVVDPGQGEAAASAAEIYRAQDQEVALLASGLPAGGAANDLEVTFAVYDRLLPQAVAVVDPETGGFQADRRTATMVAPIVKAQGRGLLSWDRGLNAADQVARREGLRSGTIFRRVDEGGTDAAAIRRNLDRAAFRAAQEGRVIVAGTANAATVAALLSWAVEGRGTGVSLAPLSAALVAQ